MLLACVSCFYAGFFSFLYSYSTIYSIQNQTKRFIFACFLQGSPQCIFQWFSLAQVLLWMPFLMQPPSFMCARSPNKNPHKIQYKRYQKLNIIRKVQLLFPFNHTIICFLALFGEFFLIQHKECHNTVAVLAASYFFKPMMKTDCLIVRSIYNMFR